MGCLYLVSIDRIMDTNLWMSSTAGGHNGRGTRPKQAGRQVGTGRREKESTPRQTCYGAYKGQTANAEAKSQHLLYTAVWFYNPIFTEGCTSKHARNKSKQRASCSVHAHSGGADTVASPSNSCTTTRQFSSLPRRRLLLVKSQFFIAGIRVHVHNKIGTSPRTTEGQDWIMASKL